MADPERLRRGLHLLAAAGVRYVVYTGGEPLLYPHLLDILSEARELGIQNLLCTNGRLLNRDKVDTLQKAGVSHLIISIDAASESEHDNHRGLPGLCRAIQDLLPQIKRSGMKPVASVTISRLFSDFEVLGKFLAHLGFELVTFSYPLTTLNSSYLSYASHDVRELLGHGNGGPLPTLERLDAPGAGYRFEPQLSHDRTAAAAVRPTPAFSLSGGL